MANKYIYSENNLGSTSAYGVGGISGDKFVDVAGWEHGTVGFAGNVFSRLASENGIQPVDPSITASREPFRVGRFLLKILKTVPFFDKKVAAAWRYIIEDTATAFSGIQSYGFEVFTRTHGVIRQTSAYTGIFKENNGEFNITVPETAGQLVRKAIDYWFYGMSDPKTGVAHFYGKDMRDLQPNKSMTILYVLLGPTCRPEDIEYAAIWHDAVITTPKHDHVNAGTLGEAGSGVDHELTFNGIFDRGPEVDRLAAIIVDREGLYEERSQNALLPAYIYNQYMNNENAVNEFDGRNHSMLLSDRLAQAMTAGEEGSSSSEANPTGSTNVSGLNNTSPDHNGEWTTAFDAADGSTTDAIASSTDHSKSGDYVSEIEALHGGVVSQNSDSDASLNGYAKINTTGGSEA